MNPIQLANLAHQLADRACIADIEGEGVAECDEHGLTWYDTRPMLDPREMPEDFIEMSRQSLSYAHDRGLVIRHPQRTYLVRVLKVSL